jgi:hypothetical protein
VNHHSDFGQGLNPVHDFCGQAHYDFNQEAIWLNVKLHVELEFFFHFNYISWRVFLFKQKKVIQWEIIILILTLSLQKVHHRVSVTTWNYSQLSQNRATSTLGYFKVKIPLESSIEHRDCFETVNRDHSLG